IGGSDGDTLSGGAGDDKIEGGIGNDIISGGEGLDSLGGGDGNDVLNGGLGFDTVSGEGGGDEIRVQRSEASTDVILGGTGADRIVNIAPGAPLVFASFAGTLMGIESLWAGASPLYGDNAVNVFDFRLSTTSTGGFVDLRNVTLIDVGNGNTCPTGAIEFGTRDQCGVITWAVGQWVGLNKPDCCVGAPQNCGCRNQQQ
ncbi:MAG: calcium-binding protein, partial [Flammeovirgaceae bacterium]